MGVRVDEAGQDRHATGVAHLGAVGEIEGARGAEGRDPVGLDEDVAALDDLVAAHRDEAGPAEEQAARGEVAQGVELDPHLGGPVAGLLVGGAVLLRLAGGLRRPGLVRFGRLHAVGERLGLLEVVAEVGVAQRPDRHPPVRAPGRELAAELGDPRDGHRGGGRIAHRHRGRLAADLWNGQQVEVVGHLGQRPASGGRHPDRGGVGGRAAAVGREAGHLQVLLLVGAVPAHRGQSPLARVQVDAVGLVGAEVRPRAAERLGHHARRARLLGVVPDDVGPSPSARAGQAGARGGLQHDDPLSVRRPGRRAQVAPHLGQAPHVVALGAHPPEVPAPGLRPGHRRDGPAVGRPGGVRDRALDPGADPARLPPAPGVRHVQPAEGRERDLAPVGRERHVADLAHAERRRVGDRVVEVEAGPRVHHHVGLEGNRLGPASVERHPPHPAAVGGDERTAVGREGVAGQQVEGRPALHVVALHRIDEPALVAAGEVAGAEPRLVLVARAVDQGGAVGRDGGAERRTVAARHRGLPSGLAVVADELVLGERRVVGPVARPLRQVDVAARGIEGGADRLELLGLVDQRDPAPAVAVEEPGLCGSSERAEGPRRDQVVAVRETTRATCRGCRCRA